MCFRHTSHWIAFATLVAAGMWINMPEAAADPAFSQSFDGPELAWELLETGTPAKVLLHSCLAGGARDHDGIERVAVATGLGQSALISCKTPPIAALDELQARVWVKSSRPDLQLAGRIVLPRSLDPRTSQPATAIVKGDRYSRAGHWQELVLRDVPKLLAAEARVMRTTPGAKIDSREAYLDAVVLVVPGDPNGVELGTDQLVVEGVKLDAAKIAQSAAANLNAAKPQPPGQLKRVTSPPSLAAIPAPAQSGKIGSESNVRMQGSLLQVDGRPFLPRAVQWNGEPLQFLTDRGFNTVVLATPPSVEQSSEAKRIGLWFICIPPRPDTINREGLGAEGDRVLAWKLEDSAIAADPKYALRWAAAVRDRDRVYGRPILGAADAAWGSAGKVVDVLVAEHPRISCISTTEYDAWLAAQPKLAKPGTPVWAEFNSQFGEAVHQQTKTLFRMELPSPSVDFQQLEASVHTACTNGVRGFVFQSSSSLSENDSATRSRTAGLELINRRLQLIEPWLAGGKVVSKVTSSDGRFDSLVFYVDGARLLIPLPINVESPQAGNRQKRGVGKDVTFLIPGVSESSQAYFVTPVSMTSLITERVAGGTRLTVPAPNAGLVVVTEDPLIVRALRQRIDRQASATLRLERDMLAATAQSLVEADRRVGQLRGKAVLAATETASVNTRLSQLDSLISANQAEAAQSLQTMLQSDVDRLMREARRSVGLDSGLENNAYGLQFAHLADFVALQQSFANLRISENLLVGGDFEKLEDMTEAGWKHVVPANAGASTHVQLTMEQPQHGTYCLELQASASSGTAVANSEPRVWINSPVVPLDAAGRVEITGWVKINQPFATPGEGLTIIDSLGGPELAVVVNRTSGWQLFRMIRAEAEPTSLQLTFALTGTGTASVDAVMVRTLQQPIARRLPPVNVKASTKTTASAELPGPVLELPQTR